MYAVVRDKLRRLLQCTDLIEGVEVALEPPISRSEKTKRGKGFVVHSIKKRVIHCVGNPGENRWLVE